MKKNLKRALKTMSILLILISFTNHALPKFKVLKNKNAQGISRIKLTNETNSTLACFIAIDGYKKKFILGPFNDSKWYAATDIRFNHTDFRTWCNLLEFYPHYEKYRQ